MRATAGALVCAVVLEACRLSMAVAQQPDAAGTGLISGVVVDKSTGDPIIEAGVEVLGPGTRVRTDLDGKYSVKVPPGTYQVRFFAPLYQGSRIEKVVVKLNDTTQVNVSLVPEGEGAVEVVEVVAEAKKAAEATQLAKRKAAPVVMDSVGSQEIQKSTDSDAAEVAVRLPSITIDRDDDFVFVRGLSERYTLAVLNKSRLPSTDPDRRVIPLDVFPANVIEEFSIIKTYRADFPGDASGGLIDITLREPPDRLEYSIGANMGVNSQSTFQDFATYDGSSADIFGLGAGSRSLPKLIPDTQIKNPQPAQQRAYAASFKNIWAVDNDEIAPPNFGLNFSVGNTFGPLGLNLAGLWKNEYTRRPNELAVNYPSRDKLEAGVGNRFNYLHTIGETRLTGVFGADYELSPDHRFDLRAFVDHSSDNEVYDGNGFDEALGENAVLLHQTVLLYVEEQLGYGQLTGGHHFDWVDVDWRTALSQTTQNAPDNRFLLYQSLEGGAPQLFAKGENVMRTFSTLDEYLTDSAVDLTFPFTTGLPYTDVWSGLRAKFQTGLNYAYRSRNFNFRRFVYDSNNLPVDLSAPAEQLLVPENIGTIFSFREASAATDTFKASQEIAALYGMFDLPIIQDRLNLNAGVRLEYSYIQIDGSTTGGPFKNFINDLNPLPAITLIYSLREDMKLLAAFSQTVSRPEFRELTPGQFPVPQGERQVIGNPNLVSASIDSFDLRWDWFLSPLEMLSASFFYKSLDMPIEQIVIGLSASSADSFANANSADLWGFEFEVRQDLEELAPVASKWNWSAGAAPYLKNVRFIVNASVIESTADLRGLAGTQTSDERQLQGQAPFIVNAALEYDDPDVVTTRLAYNTVGNRLAAAGIDLLPDIFEQRRDQLDFVARVPIAPFDVPLVASFTVENILNSPYDEVQGSRATANYANGVVFNMGLSYTF